MLVTIDQYSEEVFISGNPPIFAMDIRYSGTFVGQLHIPAQVVSISKNRILLSRVDGLNFEGLLLSYKGNLSLNKYIFTLEDLISCQQKLLSTQIILIKKEKLLVTFKKNMKI